MSYIKPDVRITQQFSSSTTTLSDNAQNVMIVGPAYTMVDAEDHSAVPYTGANQSYTFAVDNADIRAVNNDEVPYPVEVTLADAKCLVATTTAAMVIPYVASGTVYTGTEAAKFTNLPATGDCTIKFTTGVSKHYLDVLAISADGAGGITADHKTITLNGPLAQDLDTPDGVLHIRYLYLDGGHDAIPIVSIGADRTTLIVHNHGATWDAGAIVPPTGMYSYGTAGIFSDPKTLHTIYEAGKEFPITRIDANSISISGITPSMDYSSLVASVYYTHDVVYADARAAGCTLTATTCTLPAGLLDDLGFAITTSLPYLKYRALKTTLNLIPTRIDISDYATAIAATLGVVVPANTGAYAVNEACKNSLIDVYFLGVDLTYYTNVATAFAEADTILRDFDAYHVVPLSMDTDVHTTFLGHVNYCSQADIGKFRVTYLSHKLVTEQSIADGVTGHPASHTEGIIFNSETSLKFVDISVNPAANFVVDNVVAGHILKPTAWTEIVPTITYFGGANVTDTQTGNVGAPVPITWTALTKTMTLKYEATGTLAKLRALIAAGKAVGRCIKLVGGGGAGITDTSADLTYYSDDTHDYGFTTQTFGDLGYKISYALDTNTAPNVGTVTLKLEAVGTAPALDLTWAGATAGVESVVVTVYDSILSSDIEDTLMADGIVIKSVSDATTLFLETGLYNWGTPTVPAWHRATYNGMTYNIVRAMTKDEQAAYISDYAASFASRRVRLVWSDLMETSDGTELWGYMLAAQMAGAYAGVPPQESLTRHFITGSYSLKHSNFYFSNSQLNILAEHGVSIFTQTVDGARIQCRHNQTSDTTTVYYTEPSITHSVDRASTMVKLTLDRLIGIYNIVPELFDVSSMALESIKKRCEKTQPRVGGILRKFEVVSLSPDPTQADYVYCELNCVPNVPCNGFNVTFKVS